LLKRILSAFAALAVAAGLGLSASQPAQAGNGFVPIVKPLADSTPVGPTKAIIGKDRKVHQDERAGVSALVTNEYGYTVAAMDGTGTGITWDMNIEDPWKSPAEVHTLAQTAICKDGSTDDCVEFGWIKGSATSVCPAGAGLVCLFAGVRVGGVWRGYQGTEWVDNASNTTINRQTVMTGAIGSQRHFEVRHNAASSRWEVWYGTGVNGGTWKDIVGWFPDSVWGGNYTSATYTIMYTESVSQQRDATLQCTDHGTNVQPTTTAGFKMNNLDLLGTTTEVMNNFISPTVTGRGSVKVSNTEARLGGPGPC
jgi:hypothetical protein